MVALTQLPGMQEAKAHLLQAFTAHRNSHAQLFTGQDGGGALALALAYAQLLLCERPGEEGPCGTCPQCIQSGQLTHPDFHFIFPVVKSGTTGTSEEFLSTWREVLLARPFLTYGRWLEEAGFDKKQALIAVSESDRILKIASLRSFAGGAKIIFIWMPEKMNVNAANKLLKVLEEPEHNTFFLLVSHHPEQLLQTIKSRCQVLGVPPLMEEDLVAWLTHYGDASAEKARHAAAIARGNVGEAEEILTASNRLVAYAEASIAWLRHCFKGEWASLIRWTDEMGAEGRESLKAYLDFLADFLQRLLPLRYPQTQMPFPDMLTVAGFMPEKLAAMLDPEKVDALLGEIDRASSDIERNVQARMVLFDLSLQAFKILRKQP